jgi:hypothetical protein
MGKSSSSSRIRSYASSGEAIQTRIIEAREQVNTHSMRFDELRVSLSDIDVAVSLAANNR